MIRYRKSGYTLAPGTRDKFKQEPLDELMQMIEYQNAYDKILNNFWTVMMKESENDDALSVSGVEAQEGEETEGDAD